MTADEAFEFIVKQKWPSDEQLVRFAINRFGFGGDDGYYGITYPGDLDDYDVEILHRNIPRNMIELTFWSGPDDVLLVEETWYVKRLVDYLRNKNESGLAMKLLEHGLSAH